MSIPKRLAQRCYSHSCTHLSVYISHTIDNFNTAMAPTHIVPLVVTVVMTSGAKVNTNWSSLAAAVSSILLCSVGSPAP